MSLAEAAGNLNRRPRYNLLSASRGSWPLPRVAQFMSGPLHIAFLGCGFITAVHSRQLRRLGGMVSARYASRERARADDYCRQFGGRAA